MIRRVSALCVTALLIAACGGSDGPSAPAGPSGPVEARITSAAFRTDGRVAVDVRNNGGAGTVRLTPYWRNRFAGSPVITCNSTTITVAGGTSISRVVSCENDWTVDWIVVESQATNGQWARTGCAARDIACPAALQAER